MIEISQIAVTLLLLLAAIATYLSIKNFIRWKDIDIDNARARVFLDRSFLDTNFKLTLILVGLLLLHFIIMEYVEFAGIALHGSLHVVYYSVLIVSVLALVLLVHKWYILLHKK